MAGAANIPGFEWAAACAGMRWQLRVLRGGSGRRRRSGAGMSLREALGLCAGHVDSTLPANSVCAREVWNPHFLRTDARPPAGYSGRDRAGGRNSTDIHLVPVATSSDPQWPAQILGKHRGGPTSHEHTGTNQAPDFSTLYGMFLLRRAIGWARRVQLRFRWISFHNASRSAICFSNPKSLGS
jgi:hypothetical protein